MSIIRTGLLQITTNKWHSDKTLKWKSFIELPKTERNLSLKQFKEQYKPSYPTLKRPSRGQNITEVR